ncbi:MAG: DUF488 family protein [Byssovorax sp.]
MNGARNSRPFSVVPGQGAGDGRRVGRLSAVEPIGPAVHQQLGFVAVSGRAETVISLGIDGMDWESFRELILAFNIRRVVDIRLLPAFLGRGFDPAVVFDVFSQRSIIYERMLQLSNRFLGDSVNQHVVFNKFQAYLRDCKEPLLRLREQIEQGPLLLLGRAADHHGSERDAVLSALGAIKGGFELIAVDPRRIPVEGAAEFFRDLRALNGSSAQVVVKQEDASSHPTNGGRKRRLKRRRPQKVQHKLKFDA